MKMRKSFNDWKTLIQYPAQLDRDSINKMLKDWESDRTRLKDELDSVKLTFDDLLNYAWVRCILVRLIGSILVR
jgi:hypothetical protein